MERRERNRLISEIDEIENIIAPRRGSKDLDTCWAIYLLEYCQQRKRRRLREWQGSRPKGQGKH